MILLPYSHFNITFPSDRFIFLSSRSLMFSLIFMFILFSTTTTTTTFIHCDTISSNNKNELTNQQPQKFYSITNTESVLSEGKQEYELLLQRKKNPIYGTCWTNAVVQLERNCDDLDENRQSWLAILFTDCFLKTAGLGNDLLAIEPCHKLIVDHPIANGIKECIQNIDGKIFHTYSLFFVHTQSICFYLHSKQWQKHTDNLIDNLVKSAQIVSTDLNSAVGNIRHLEVLQNTSLKAQLSLNDELLQAKNSLEKFQEQTKEQRDLLEKIIDQFILLRQFILVEFSTNSSIVFYIISMLAIYCITTPQRTNGVRLILYFMLLFTFILEKNAIDYLLRIDSLLISRLFVIDDFGNFNINQNIWIIRNLMLSLMGSVYFWWIVTYRDISKINYRLLKENTLILKNIEKQLKISHTNGKNNFKKI